MSIIIGQEETEDDRSPIRNELDAVPRSRNTLETRPIIPSEPPRRKLEPWVNGLAFQGQHSKDALVRPAQRLLPDEPIQRFNSECEFPAGERAFRADTAGTQPPEPSQRLRH